MIHVFLADDHSMMRSGLRRLLNEENDLVVVGEASDGWGVVRAMESSDLIIDVLLLDLSMPKLGGMEVLRRSLALRPQLAVLVLSMYPAEHWAGQLIEAGALGYVCKADSETQLLCAVRTVADGVVWQADAHQHDPLADGGPRHHRLSGRELQVFLLVVSGQSAVEVAAALNLGQSTVSTHLSRIRSKLAVDTLAAMVTYAHREGLIH